MFIFNTPEHRCSDPRIDEHSAAWEEVLPWVPRERGYPSSCSMVDTHISNLSNTYFASLAKQDIDPERFSAIRSVSVSTRRENLCQTIAYFGKGFG